jgi:diguanylate cyclase (GGDEF)-like protein
VIAQLHAAEHGLADAHATLETRVRLRTQELAAANGRLRRIADLDDLTGVPNRRIFNSALEAEWRAAVRGSRSLAVVLMDVDFFKLFNDTYGHPAGDDCLKVIADALSTGLQRNGELLARYGGEEFVALLPNVDAAEAVRTAERLRQRVAALAIPHCMPAEGARVTLSAGVAAEIPSGRRSPTDLLSRADAALYTAKHAGRDRVIKSP